MFKKKKNSGRDTIHRQHPQQTHKNGSPPFYGYCGEENLKDGGIEQQHGATIVKCSLMLCALSENIESHAIHSTSSTKNMSPVA